MTGYPQLGAQLGRFKLERKIGSGSTGTVFLANDTLLGIKVALKILSHSIAQAEAVQRLSSEVLLARRVSHPGVCRIFDLHIEKNVIFITMEYIEGPTLGEILENQKQLTQSRAGNLVVAIANALHAAHMQGVIHRGLTPKNIVVRTGDQVSIMDFGMVKARDIAETTGAGVPIESIHFVSPEVLEGNPATAQSDIYSLGAIFYRCVTGNMPFHGDKLLEITNAVLEGRLVPPNLLNPDLPQMLEKVILKAMAVRPGMRYQSIREFKEWVTAALEGNIEEQSDQADQNSLMFADIDQGVEERTEESHRYQTQQIRINQTTLLFSDIVGITPYFEKHGNIAGRKRLQKHNELLFPVIQGHKGAVIKTIGDAIMAHFDIPANGAEAAVDMQRALHTYNSKLSDDGEHIHIRIGLHTGQAIIENQDVFGDAVNVAARVSSKAEKGEILVSEFTKTKIGRLKGLISFHSTTELKGKSQQFNLYKVHWQSASKNEPAMSAAGAEDQPTQVGTVGQSIHSPAAAGKQANADVARDGSGKVTQAGAATEVANVPMDGLATLEMSAAEAPIISRRRVGQQEATGLPSPPIDDSQVKTQPGAQPRPVTTPSPAVVVETDTSRTKESSAEVAQGMKPALLVALGAGLGMVIVLAIVFIFIITRGDEQTSHPEGQAVAAGEASDETKSDGEPDDVTDTRDNEDTDEAKAEKGLSSDDKGEKQADEDGKTAGIADKDPVKTGSHSGQRRRKDARLTLLAQKKRFKSAFRSLGRAMRRAGVMHGDDQHFDAQYEKIMSLKKKAKYNDARDATVKALEVLDEVKIDKSFIQAKLLRFNRRFDKVGDVPQANELEEMAMRIMSAFEAGKYAEANRLINRSFRLLDKIR